MRIKRLFNPKEGPAPSQLTTVALLTFVILTIGLYVGTSARAEASSARSYPAQLDPSQPAASAVTRSPDTSRHIANPPAPKAPVQLALLNPGSSPVSNTGDRVSMAAPPNRIRVSSGVMAGAILTRVDPIYPPDARSSGIQGAVVLRVVISKDGDITDLDPISGPEELRGQRCSRRFTNGNIVLTCSTANRREGGHNHHHQLQTA